MKKMTMRGLLVMGLLGLLPAGTNAQSFATTGTRAAGMGGAFVGVADDATAIYWNPAGLASGAFFSLVLDSGRGEAFPAELFAGEERSSYLLALTTPALGLGYYRLGTSTARAPLVLTGLNGPLQGTTLSIAPETRLDSLVTHHAGVTLVQSITQGLAVGTTLKLVRGLAGSRVVSASGAKQALEDFGEDLLGRASNKFDADIGVMAYGGPLKVGLTVRNVSEPGFEVAGGDHELVLERQARAGLSYAVTRNWLAAADFDLLKTAGLFGNRRDAAFGVEGRLTPRIFVRSGLSFNTLGSEDRAGAERGAAYSVGGSFAARAAVFIDGHFTTGDGLAGHQWGVAARFIY